MAKDRLLLSQSEIPSPVQKESVSETAESIVATSMSDWHSAPIELLGLSVRPYNALKRGGLATLGEVLAFLEAYEASGTKSVRNVGPQSIAELQDKLAKYLQKPKYKPLAEKTFALVLPDKRTLSPQNRVIARCQELQDALAAEITRQKLHGQAIVDDRTVSDWLDLDCGSSDEFVLRQICRSFEQALANRTICDELTKLFTGIAEDRIEVFFDRMGPKKHTLEQIGRKKGLTRERIRQIAEKMKNRICERISLDHYVRIQSGLLVAKDMGSGITYSDWVRHITATGLLGNWDAKTMQCSPERINPVGLMLAVCSQLGSSTVEKPFQIPENLRIAMACSPSASPDLIKMLSAIPKRTVRSIRKEAKNGGAVHVPSLARKLALTLDQTQRLLSEWGYKQIASDWYMLRPRKRAGSLDQTWAVFHTVLKMLKFCDPLDMKEIWRGVRSHVSRRGHVVPPPSTLLQVLLAYGFQLEDGRLSWSGANGSQLSASETLVLREIRRLGPVVSHYDLSQAFMEASLSLPALSNTLAHSPLFAKVKAGFYKIRGSSISQEHISKAEERQLTTVANPEVIYDTSGTIRFRLNLGNIAAATGSLFTTHIPNLTGNWSACANDVPCGVVHVSDKQLWGLGKSFRAIKVQVGERVELKFNTWQRTVNIAKVSNESQ